MNEKKWFVYLGDHHEGPFSVDEIRQKMEQGLVSSQSYVWAEGMADWQGMTEVADFKSLTSPVAALEVTPPPTTPLVGPLESPSTVAAEQAADPSVLVLESPAEGAMSAATAAASQSFARAESPRIIISPSKSTPISTSTYGANAPFEMGQAPVDNAPLAKPAKRKSGGFIKFLLFLILLSGGFGAFLAGYLDAFLPSEAASVSARRTLMGLARPFLSQIEEQVPAVGVWLSPISRPEDVTDEEFQTLRRAASGNGLEGVNSVGLAIAKTDPTQPTFYVSADLPDGALFEVVVRGVPGTLLNATGFERTLKVTLMEHLGRSGALKAEDNSPLPKGEYQIYAYESADQSPAVQQTLAQLQPSARKLPEGMPVGRKLVTLAEEFLGGPKDAAYSERLKEFHDRLKQKALAEITETRQFANTLESQLSISTQEFGRIRAMRNPIQRKKAWADFNTHWSQLTGQLTQTFQTWTPDALQGEYFYGPIYIATQQAGVAVTAAQAQRNDFMTQPLPKDLAAAEATLTTVAVNAQTAVNNLKDLITKAETLQQSAGGIPQKLAP